MEFFISYSHADEPYRRELEKHLSNLRDQQLITAWHDRRIAPGQEWEREIDAQLESAAVILLLVSSDFMHSRYCSQREMVRALARHRAGEAVVIPVIVRPVDFDGAPFAGLQGLPTDARPVSTWANHDEAWVDVVRGIRRAIQRIRPRTPGGTSPAQMPKRPRRDPPEDDYEELRGAFIQVFGKGHRAFGQGGKRRGVSDGNEGVQWNAGFDPREGRRWAGVNLEGMQYRGWPVARLIERELRSPTLPGLIQQLGATDPVEVRWRRDYWQAASRPLIQEREIGPSPILASRLTETIWQELLRGAAECLGAGGRGRAHQEVTLARSGKRVRGPVSPHLTIAFPSEARRPWLDFLTEAKPRLQPFYDWAVERAA